MNFRFLVVLSLFFSLLKSAAASPISTLSEEAFDNQFRCPETYIDEWESKRALADTLEWYGAHHAQVTVDGFLAFRMQLLAKHKCEVSLANVAKAAVIPALPVPNYNIKKACHGNNQCIQSESEMRKSLVKIWSGVGNAAKEYCLTEGAKAHNSSYVTFVNCLAHEDKRQ